MEVETKNGKSFTDLIDRLQMEPENFEFFQAVRMIQNSFLRDQQCQTVGPLKLLGHEVRLPESLIRFRSEQSLSFAASEVTKIQAHFHEDALGFFEMTVSFIGLTGPNGVLPDHYTSLVIERSHTRNKDDTLRDFFDIFNHRAISFFYQAWQKYRLPFIYESFQLNGQREDPVTSSLLSLTGHGLQGLRNRTPFRDEVLLFYSGMFANRTRNATSLEQILSSYFDAQFRVIQFCERWIYLEPENQSSFPDKNDPMGRNLALGSEAIIGTKIREIQSLFCIQIGPLHWNEFLKFLPGMEEMKSIVKLVHSYSGGDLDFEIQLQVRADRVPPMMFSQEGLNPLSLGQTTWLGAVEPDQVLDNVSFRFGFGGASFG